MGFEAISAVIGDLVIRAADLGDDVLEDVFGARGWSASLEYPRTQLWVHDGIEARFRKGDDDGRGYVEFIISQYETDWGPSESELADSERGLATQIDDVVGSISQRSEIVEEDPVDELDDLVSRRAFRVGAFVLLFGVVPGDGVIPMMNIARLSR